MSEMGNINSYKNGNGEDDIVTNDEVDESGAVEASEYAGKAMPDVPEAKTEDVEDEEPLFDAPMPEAQEDKYAPELPITHLINPENKRVVEATPDLMKRKDLVPCDENGKKVLDHRIL
jgi:coproporphyrinogen III oxidase